MHVAAAGAGLGHHRAVPAGQLLVTGLAVSRRPARACGTARPRRPPAGSPDAPRRPRRAAAAGSARGRGRPGRCTPWFRSPPGTASAPAAIPGSPPSIRTSSGPASTVAPVDGSRSTNSSSTPSVIAAGRAHRPRRAAGHRRGPSCTARSGHYHDRLLLRERAQRQPLAQRAGQAGHCAGCGDQRPQQRGQRDGGCRLHGHRLGAGQRDDLPGCLPGCLQRLPGRDRQGLGHCLVLSVVQDTPKPEGQRRLTSGMAPRRSRQAQRPFIASPWPGATRARWLPGSSQRKTSD